MRKLSLIVIFGLLCLAALAETSPKTGAISGRVIRANNGQPIAKVKVVLIKQKAPLPSGAIEDFSSLQSSTMTDGEGKFEFDDLEPSSYIVSAEKPGFIDETASSNGDGSSRTLTVKAGATEGGIEFRLLQGAVLAGRVLNEDGEPMPKAMISVMRTVYSLKGKSLQPFKMETTNDLGEFRVYGLAPGSYFVFALVQEEVESVFQRKGSSQKTLVYPPVYYPGTQKESDAAPIRLTAGEEARADFSLAPVHAIVVRGKVVGVPRGKNGEPQQTMVILGSDRSEMISMPHIAQLEKDGKFELQNVTPGNYTLVALSGEQRGAMGSGLLGRTDISAGETDIDGVEIAIEPYSGTIKGRVIVEGTSKPGQSEGLMINLQPQEAATSSSGLFGESGGAGYVTKDGTFTLQSFGDGMFSVNVTASRSGFEDWYLKSIRYAGQDGTENGIKITSARGELELVMRTDGPKVSGVALDPKDKPLPNAHVVLIPEARWRKRVDLYLTATTDASGHFEFRGVMPSDYTAMVVPNSAPEGIYFDPDWVREHEAEGVAVKVDKGGAAPVKIKLPAAE